MDVKKSPEEKGFVEIREEHAPGCGLFFKIQTRLHSETSAFQKIEVVKNDVFGNILFLDGLVQTTEKDEYFYHEMLTHPALMTHSNPKNCLIIGGGDGGTLREVLRHPVDKAVLVEIDPRVMVVCRRFFPWLEKAEKDERALLITADGDEFIKDTSEKFDIILIDSSEPVGPSSVLHSREFHEKLKHALNPGGIIAAQAGSPFFHLDHLRRQITMLKPIYTHVSLYTGMVPTYPGGSWSYLFLSMERSPERIEQVLPEGLRYYTPQLHRAAFALPVFLKKVLAQ